MKNSKPCKISPFCAILLVFLCVFHNPWCVVGAKRRSSSPIKTIVVLVMENRSFDHLIGWMKNSINSNIDGVTGDECNPVSTQGKMSHTICFTDDAEYVDADPGHTFDDVKLQVFGSGSIPSMLGFVQQALSLSPDLSETVMKGFKPENVPVYASLVKEFAVFDRWFSSIPGPTQPNRLFVYSATSHGATSHVTKQLTFGYPQRTIFDSMYDDGMDFGIYFQTVPSTLFYRNLRKLKYVFKFHQYDLMFKKHAREGKLPALTVIEPRYFDLVVAPANDDHPAHDVANGQKLVKEVYETLRASPQWNETLLIITYDEHGGFFDHVQTPYVDVPNPDGNSGPAPDFFKFDRLGVRVPTIMVSPWIKKGTVMRKPKGPTPDSEFEHSSVPATIKKMFNLSSNFLTHRDAWAGTFEDIVGGLTSPRTDCPGGAKLSSIWESRTVNPDKKTSFPYCKATTRRADIIRSMRPRRCGSNTRANWLDEFLPDVTPLRKTDANETRELSSFQSEIVQLAAVLKGDHYLSSFPDEMTTKMNVKEADEYVRGAVSRFIRAGKEALKLGADSSAIVDMRSSLTTRSSMNRP